MYYADDPSAVAGASPPAPSAAYSALPSWYTEGNALSGTPATPVHADWLNATTQELIGVVSGAGLTPSKTNNAQVLAALKRIAAGDITVVSANATLTADNAGLILINTGSGALTLTLPAAASATGVPIRFHVRRVDTSAGNAFSIALSGGDTFAPGGSSPASFPPGEAVDLVSDGVSAWRVTQTSRIPQVQTFVASGLFTVPAGVTCVDAEVWGGGAGSPVSTSTQAANGGGGGGYARRRITGLVPGQVIPVTIGPGGQAGLTTGVPPTSGGTTSFGSYVSATGGSTGGPGGIGINGDVIATGSNGWGPISNSYPGAGGAGAMGGGLTTPAGLSTNGYFPGGGAPGSISTTQNGGQGANGFCVVRW